MLLPHPDAGGEFASPVTPGSGWPIEPADAATPVARTYDDVREGAELATGLADLDARVSVCHACDRLVDWRTQVATEKRRSFSEQPYWGRPVPAFGDARPWLLIVGLAPAAHGANRTGRMFTGDRSGDWLYAALYRAGLANQPESTSAADGLTLTGARITAAVRCAPPANKPTPAERDTCGAWLRAELRMVLPTVRAVIALGSYGWEATLQAMREVGYQVPRPRPKFGHAARVRLEPEADAHTAAVEVFGCYHPSQQNTFTGKLTEGMLDNVFEAAERVADRG